MSAAATFRHLALALPSTTESSHMGSPDFRLNGRIFATLAYEGKGLGTLKLTPEQQAALLPDGSEFFSAAPGGWGRMGMTLVRLDAPASVLSGALQTAYNNVAHRRSTPKTPADPAPPATKAVRSPRAGRAGSAVPRLQ